MVNKEVLLENFKITGIENVDDEILQKCIELCHWCGEDEEGFIDMWVAHSINHLDGNLEPNLKALESMKSHIPKKNIEDSVENENTFNYSSVKRKSWTDEQEMLETYANSETLSLMAKRPRTPDNIDNDIKECKTPHSESIVHISTPSASSSQSPWSQKSSGKEVFKFGPIIKSWVNEEPRKCVIRKVGPHVPPKCRHMFELLKTTSDIRTRVCRKLGLLMTNLWSKNSNDDIAIEYDVRTRSQKIYRTWGRVCWESEVKQENSPVLLEGCRKSVNYYNDDRAARPEVELDFSKLNECCVFPGQILAVEGVNLTGNTIMVDKIFSESYIKMAKPPTFNEKLKVMVAAGPFTERDNLNYEPLWDLMDRISNDEPHILILIGPFLDENHPMIKNVLNGSDSITTSYQDFFEKLVTKIMGYVAGKCTQVVLVPSNKDAHHYAVYPTPEYNISKHTQNPDLHLLPDPCTLDIDGLRIGITSVDSLMHIGRQEAIVKATQMDKLSRLGNYLLNQACFYPLYPPAKEVAIDSELWEKYAFMKEKPHMLILPSDMRYFCKNVNETVILNPERLIKRLYTKMHFQLHNNLWTNDSISCEIYKV